MPYSRAVVATARARRVKIALVGIGAAVGVALAAAGLYLSRTTHYDSHAYDGIYRESADPVLRVELIPRVNAYINADGFFGRDYARAKPPDTWRIVGVGDSVTMYYAAEQLGYLSLLERSLPAAVGRDVEVLNLAVASYETPQQVRSLVTRGLRYEPDFVVVGYCVNDGTDFVQLARAIGATAAIEGRWADDNLEVHERIRDALIAREALDPQRLFDEHIRPQRKWQESLAAFDELQSLAAREGFAVLVVLFPSLLALDDYFLAPLHRSLLAELDRRGLAALDLWPVYREAGPVVALRTGPGDSIHPSAEGHRIAALAIERWLRARRPWEQAPR